jgi:hypothetical protein
MKAMIGGPLGSDNQERFTCNATSYRCQSDAHSIVEAFPRFQLFGIFADLFLALKSLGGIIFAPPKVALQNFFVLEREKTK